MKNRWKSRLNSTDNDVGTSRTWFNNSRKPHASMAQVTESQCALTGTVYRRSRSSITGYAGRYRVRIPGAHASFEVNFSGRQEGSTVSSITC